MSKSRDTDHHSLRIGNGAGFWGDSLDAPRRLVEGGQLDYLTLEYLAELTMSILAHQHLKNPSAGFVSDIVTVVKSIAKHLVANVDSGPLKIVSNAGGMNPAAAARAVSDVLVHSGLSGIRVAAVSGDCILDRIDELIGSGESFSHFDDGRRFAELRSRCVSGNVYMGASGIVEALESEAQIVLTGRVADASLVVGPLVHEFGWAWDDWKRLGVATVVGHLIECGAQVTGGMYSDWHADLDLENVGYPIAEVATDGSIVISKPPGSGGEVSTGTVAEQLVYEIGDPQRYMTPDVVADFSQVQLTAVGKDQVAVSGATGSVAPDRLKVSMAYDDGYMVSGMIVVCGRDAVSKARAAAESVQSRVTAAGFQLEQYEHEVVGAGDLMPGLAGAQLSPHEVVLRIAARDASREAVERVARELAPLVTSGPPGVTGYTVARPKTRPVLAYWPTTIARDRVSPTVDVRSAKEWLS